MKRVFEMEFEGRHLQVEIGEIAKQAAGACLDMMIQLCSPQYAPQKIQRKGLISSHLPLVMKKSNMRLEKYLEAFYAVKVAQVNMLL